MSKGKVLLIRLSSFGDIVLTTAAIETCVQAGYDVEFVTTTDFSFVLQGDPRIKKLWLFEKKQGLKKWISLGRQIFSSGGYSAVFDLHRNIRTWVWKSLFRNQSWKSISKERLRTGLLLLMRNKLPTSWRPTPYHQRFSHVCAKALGARPAHPHLISAAGHKSNFYAVMPSSKWPTKEWGYQHFFDLIRLIHHASPDLVPLILGRGPDASSVKLYELLRSSGIPFLSLIDEPDFSIQKRKIQSCRFFVGVDTGFAHVAEALGVPAFIVFGPTQPEIGFGPWKTESKAMSLNLSCSPCSKSGSKCYRWFDRFACMKDLDPKTLVSEILSSQGNPR